MKITINRDTDRQALREFYTAAISTLNTIRTQADALQAANLSNLTQTVNALKQVGAATGQLAQGLQMLLKGIKNRMDL